MAVSGCCGGDGGGSEWVHWCWLVVVTAPLLVVVVAVLLAVVVVACGVAAVSGCGRWCVCAAVLRVCFSALRASRHEICLLELELTISISSTAPVCTSICICIC